MLTPIKTILDIFGYISSILVISSAIFAVILWLRGILPVVFRIGNRLAKVKIAICAKGDRLNNLKSLLLDTGLFLEKNIILISGRSELGRAERASIYLVLWKDWKDDISKIIRQKSDNNSLIVYCPPEDDKIPHSSMNELNEEKNVMVTNFRGRLLSDILVSMITMKA